MKTVEHIFEFFFTAIVGILNFIFDVLEEMVGTEKKKHTYKAEFVSQRTLLSSNEYGFCLNGRHNLSVKNSYQNALIIGGTGTGKSSIVLIPSLFTMRGSFIVHDPSGELFTKTAGYLKEKGYDIKVLHFAKPELSSGYNPLARAYSSSDIQKIASLLIANTLGKGKDPFWNLQATALLSMLISILKKQDPEFQNLFNVRQLLNNMGSNQKAMDQLFSTYADDVLFSEYKSFISFDDKVISGIIATCKAALQLFSDESVAQVSSFDTLHFQDFRNTPTVLYIQNSVADQKYYSVLTSIFFEQFFSYIMSRFPKDEEQDIFLLIDEASSLNLPTLPLAMANIRKHRTGAMLLVQHDAQLLTNYGKADSDAIKANCLTKVFFTGQPLETTKELEQTLGLYQFEDEKGNTVTRPLMKSDEIRIMDNNKALLISGHHQPIIAKLRPFYKNHKFKRYCQITPPNMNSGNDHAPTLLTLSSPSENDE